MLKEYYHCKAKKREGSDIIDYQKPIQKWGNYQTLSGYIDIVKHGKNVDYKWRLTMRNTPQNQADFQKGDLLYLDMCKPNPEDTKYGNGANARITDIHYGFALMSIEIDSVIKVKK